MGGTKGSHLVIDNRALYDALGDRMVYYEHADGRICITFRFMDKVIMGSTDIRVANPDDAACEDAEQRLHDDEPQGRFPRLEAVARRHRSRVLRGSPVAGLRLGLYEPRAARPPSGDFGSGSYARVPDLQHDRRQADDLPGVCGAGGRQTAWPGSASAAWCPRAKGPIPARKGIPKGRPRNGSGLGAWLPPTGLRPNAWPTCWALRDGGGTFGRAAGTAVANAA